jgi:4-hydroxyproline epimerase
MMSLALYTIAYTIVTPAKIHVVDSHTGGEPTRVVISGGPPLGNGSLAERLKIFRNEYDHFRSAIVNEPRGSDAIVGALLCDPEDASCSAGVIFFNNVGYIGMCGHGTIGLAVTLAYLGRIGPGVHRIETPVGVVAAHLHENGEVTVDNVAGYRWATDVSMEVPGFGKVTGDVAWGGNWFFITHNCPMTLSINNLDALTDYAKRIRGALTHNGITGEGGAEIDHIEVCGPAVLPGADSKNFVLCPGGSYDRSPCGTGTSAKMACLYAAGTLKDGDIWRQESLIGSVFEGSVSVRDGEIYPHVKIYPHIKGSAFITADAQLILSERDPFLWGIPRL